MNVDDDNHDVFGSNITECMLNYQCDLQQLMIRGGHTTDGVVRIV